MTDKWKHLHALFSFQALGFIIQIIHDNWIYLVSV